MNKPIFIVKVPDLNTTEYLDSISFKLGESMPDYHVLVISCKVDDVSFECYNTTDLDDKSFEELKQIVKNIE